MNKKYLLSIIAIILVVGGFLFFGGSKGKNDNQLRFAHDKGSWNFQPSLELVGKKNDVTFVDTAIFADATAYTIAIQSSLNADKATYDLISWWSGVRLKEAVEVNWFVDISSAWEYAIQQGWYTEEQKAMFSANGKAYAVPMHISTWAIYYHRKTFEELNLSPPKTWAEFLAVIDTLKKAGKIPIVSRGNGWEAFTWFAELLARTGSKNYNDLMNGKISYTSEPVRKVFQIWKDLYARGAFSNPSITKDEESAGVLSGKFVMSLGGDWNYRNPPDVPEKTEDIWGVFPLPPFNEGDERTMIYEVALIAFSKNSASADKAVDMAKTWFSQENTELIVKEIGVSTGHLKVAPPNALYVTMEEYVKANSPTPVLRYWEATPTEIAQKAVDEFYRFMLKPNDQTAAEVMTNIDRIATEYWNKQKMK